MQIDIDEYSLEVEITRFSQGCPARLNALPEDCYPAEDDEVEFVVVGGTITDEDGAERELTAEEISEVSDLHAPLIEELILKAMASAEPDIDYEPSGYWSAA